MAFDLQVQVILVRDPYTFRTRVSSVRAAKKDFGLSAEESKALLQLSGRSEISIEPNQGTKDA